jgi:hypothetical protein
MTAVRRLLATSGLAGALLLAPAGAAMADPTPSPAPSTTTDCGQVGPGGQPASPLPPGTVCVAGGLNPGANPGEVTQVNSGSGAGTLPRTGPAPLVPTLALGGWLVLFGLLVALAGRRRTAHIRTRRTVC